MSSSPLLGTSADLETNCNDRAKDKMILEEAYKNNPKPDKQARLEIVDRVSLSEKEVQVGRSMQQDEDGILRWTGPNASRPPTIHRDAMLTQWTSRYGSRIDDKTTAGSRVPCRPRSLPLFGTAASLASLPTPPPEAPSSLRDLTRPRTPLPHGQPTVFPCLPRSNTIVLMARSRLPMHPHRDKEARRASYRPSPARRHSKGTTPHLRRRLNRPRQWSTPSRVPWDILPTGGTLAVPSPHLPHSERVEKSPSRTLPCSNSGWCSRLTVAPRRESCPPSSCSSDTGGNANRYQSHVRLSLSLEGKAEIVSKQHSPARAAAPPRPSSALSGHPQARRAGLQRSQSALPSITLPPISALTSYLPPRLGRGRSRDVHAWESCADSERRDELITQAEHESKGSAIAAISLLRSSCGILQPSSTKRNASVSRPPQARQDKRTKLGRTSSTYARLENVGIELDKPRESLNGKVKVAMLVSPNDSDKENLSPDDDASSHDRQRRRPLPADPPSKPQHARRQARALLDQKRPGLLNSRANTAPLGLSGSAKGAVAIYEDPVRRSREDEVARFMRGEVSPGKKGDMDCVAGLLSLSQGAWR